MAISFARVALHSVFCMYLKNENKSYDNVIIYIGKLLKPFGHSTSSFNVPLPMGSFIHLQTIQLIFVCTIRITNQNLLGFTCIQAVELLARTEKSSLKRL